MPTVQRGRIKFFNIAQGWGIIIPNDGGADVFYHIRAFAGLLEIRDGELEFIHFPGQSTLYEYHMPREDELVAYLLQSQKSSKGPRASHWLYLATYQRAEEVLAYRRKSRDNYDLRVVCDGEVSWEGTKQEYFGRLEASFPEIANPRSTVEKMEISGNWTEVPHPRNWHHRHLRRA